MRTNPIPASMMVHVHADDPVRAIQLADMREITTHQTNDCNKRIKIHVRESESEGRFGYLVEVIDKDVNLIYACVDFEFHRGDITEVGVIGLTNEVLYAILIDRLEGHQTQHDGKFACEENAEALAHTRLALQELEKRTRKRVARGVEGKQVP